MLRKFRFLRFVFASFYLLLMLAACANTAAEPTPAATATAASTATAAIEPTATATPIILSPTATAIIPTAEPTTVVATAALQNACLDHTQAAVLLASPLGLQLWQPRDLYDIEADDSACTLNLPQGASASSLITAADGFYFERFNHEEGTAVVERLTHDDNTLETLAFTAVSGGSVSGQTFAISPDGHRIAWTHPQGMNEISKTDVFIADLDGANQELIFSGYVARSTSSVINIVRFSADGQTLYLNEQLDGIGGMWIGFHGRYQTLYAQPVDGSEGRIVFNCDDINQGFCLGDFTEQFLAYTADGQLHIETLDGQPVAVHTPAESDDYEYIGYPLFGAAGDLIFHTAKLDPENDFSPTRGTHYLLPYPYQAAPHVIFSGAGLMPPMFWLDAETFVSAYADQSGRLSGTLHYLNGESRSIAELYPESTVLSLIRGETRSSPHQTTLPSPDGVWVARAHNSAQVAAGADETAAFPLGTKHYVSLTVSNPTFETFFTPIAEWRRHDLGYTVAAPLRWTADSRSLFYTNDGIADGGCTQPTADNLYQLDVQTGQTTQLLAQPTWKVDVTADGQTVAYIPFAPTEPAALIIRNVQTAAEQTIPLPYSWQDGYSAENDGWAFTGLRWSPDGQHLLISQIASLCSPLQFGQTRLTRIDVKTGAAAVITEENQASLSIVEWIRNDEVKLIDEQGRDWFVDVFSGFAAASDS